MNYFIQTIWICPENEEVYGMPIERLKRSLQDDTKQKLMAQTLPAKKSRELDALEGSGRFL